MGAAACAVASRLRAACRAGRSDACGPQRRRAPRMEPARHARRLPRPPRLPLGAAARRSGLRPLLREQRPRRRAARDRAVLGRPRQPDGAAARADPGQHRGAAHARRPAQPRSRGRAVGVRGAARHVWVVGRPRQAARDCRVPRARRRARRADAAPPAAAHRDPRPQRRGHRGRGAAHAGPPAHRLRGADLGRLRAAGARAPARQVARRPQRHHRKHAVLRPARARRRHRARPRATHRADRQPRGPQHALRPAAALRRCGRARAGHRVEIRTHAADPPEYHDLQDRIGLRTAAQCAQEAMHP
ncbi:hypothetical protein M2165_002801 [Variovorax sp. TBS-050B]|nr:hypothetical protein [Variovorax sp. TBS-050B]